MASADAYLDARAEFERHNEQVEALARVLSQVARAVAQRPGHFSFTNCSVRLPPQASMGPFAVGVDANDWRSAQQIHELLAKWHEARSAMIKAWQGLPQHWRRGVQPPPTVM